MLMCAGCFAIHINYVLRYLTMLKDVCPKRLLSSTMSIFSKPESFLRSLPVPTPCLISADPSDNADAAAGRPGLAVVEPVSFSVNPSLNTEKYRDEKPSGRTDAGGACGVSAGADVKVWLGAVPADPAHPDGGARLHADGGGALAGAAGGDPRKPTGGGVWGAAADPDPPGGEKAASTNERAAAEAGQAGAALRARARAAHAESQNIYSNPYPRMKRLNCDLIRAEEELAGARQCIVCLCCAVLTSCALAVVASCDMLPAWGLAAASGLMLLFLILGAVYAYLPTLREERYLRRRCLRLRSGEDRLDPP